jgi:hypothetical protein
MFVFVSSSLKRQASSVKQDTGYAKHALFGIGIGTLGHNLAF